MGKRSLYDVFMLICIGIVLTPSVFFAQTCSGNAVTVVSQTGVNSPNNALSVADATAAELWDTGDQIVLDFNKELSLNSTIVVRWRGNTVSTDDPTITVELSSDGVSFYPVIGSPFTVARTVGYVNQNITTTVVTRYIRFTTTNTYNIDLDAVTFTNQACESCGISLSTSVSSCFDSNGNAAGGTSQANVSVVVDWQVRPAGENIVLQLQGQSDVLINPSTSTKPYIYTYTLPADGSTKTVDAHFATTIGCAAIQKNVTIPSGSCANTPCLSGNTGGIIWRDINSDGIKDVSEPDGIGGVTVKLFDKIGSLFSTTTTDNVGQYTFGTLASAPSLTNKYRIEFSNLPPQYRPTFHGSDGLTDVQFITTANCIVILGANDPRDYCQATPTLGTPCYILGDQNHPTNGLLDVFISFPSTAGRAATFTATTSDYDNPTTHDISIRANQMGTTWGVAFRRTTNEIFTGAFMKRYAGFGTGGTGAVYKINPTNNTTSVFATLPNGTDGHDPTNWLRDYKTIAGNPYTNTWDAVGKSGLGDVDILEDISNPANDKLYVTNLYDQRLYELNAVTGATLASYPMPNLTTTAAHGCPTADVRPFGLGVKGGKVYVGMVCTGESTQTWTGTGNGMYDIGEAFKDDDNDNTYDVGEIFSDYGVPDRRPLFAYVYTVSAGTWSSKPVLEFSLNNARGCFGSGAYGAAHCDETGYRSARWNPWTPNYKNVADNASPVTRFAFPQPILSDIEFDAQGYMYLGFVDRGGHQVGNDQQPNPNNTDQGEGQSSGDIMIAAPLNANAWAIENNGAVGNKTTLGANNGQGSGGGEFFYQEVFPLYDETGAAYTSPPNHGEVAIGGLAVLPYSNLVASTVFDPVPINLQFHDGGVHFYNTNTGALDRTYRVFDGTNTGSLSGKTAGLGDLLMICNAQPIQIGNYVWNDHNQNGVQEAEETPLSSITVSLWKSGVQVATTTTNSAGQYYFTGIGTAGETWTSTTGTDSVLANTAYQIRIDTTNQAQLDTLKLTIANSTLNSGNDQNDSDASISGNYAVINITTGNAGENNFTYDFGFARSCDTTLTVTNTTICNGSATNLFSRVSGVQGTLTYSLNGTTWFSLSNPTNVTPSVTTTYFVKDYLTTFCQDIDTLQITVIQPVSAGTGTNPSAYCQAGSGIANLNLFNQLASETAGGVWSQVSGTTVGSALNTSMGILNPNGLVVGAYVFRYSVTGTAPCASDTEDVTVTINACCPPSICLPALIIRN